MTPIGPHNHEIATVLEEMAALLEERGEPNPYRVRAYRAAAESVRGAEAPVAERYSDGGLRALTEIPGVGENISAHIARFIEASRVGGDARQVHDPVLLFAAVPGISRALAQRFVEELGVETLSELERACYDGRTEAMRGVGRQRVRALRLQLNSLLQWAALARARRVRRGPRPLPPRPSAPAAELPAEDFRLAA